MGYIFERMDKDDERPIITIMTFWLLLVRFLPLDVILLSETSKMIYSKYMEVDARMMKVDKATGEVIRCKVQSMQLPEQLAEIDHIFSDKTGTLTQNELLFRGVSIDGHVCEGLDTETIL
jgi:magnesium-transporting ATPase (P-type)